MDSELDALKARYREAVEALDFELSEARKVRDQLLSIGQMQAILLALLERSPVLTLGQLNEIANADRKMRALDLGSHGRLRSALARHYAKHGATPPEFEIAGPGSSLIVD